MLRDATGAALLALALLPACVPPPASYPASSGGAYPARSDEMQSEYLRLRRRAEERTRDQQRRVERVGRRLLESVPNAPQIQFVIVSGEPQVNAGATFGQVAVTSGMLDFVRSDDELAVVLGHELAHITQGHVTKGALGSLALGILAIVVETQAPGAGNLAGSVGQLFLNRYTQSQERAADDVGLRYTYGAGYDPRAAVDVQERLAVAVPQTMSAGYFDTHPSSVERAVFARRLSEELLADGPPPGRDEALALERESSGRPARRARRVEPGEWPDDRDAEASYRVPERDRREGDDVRREGGERSSPECGRAATYVDMAADASARDERERLYRRALRYCPSLAEAHSGLGAVLRERGERREAEREFRRALELDPDDEAARSALSGRD